MPLYEVEIEKRVTVVVVADNDTDARVIAEEHGDEADDFAEWQAWGVSQVSSVDALPAGWEDAEPYGAPEEREDWTCTEWLTELPPPAPTERELELAGQMTMSFLHG